MNEKPRNRKEKAGRKDVENIEEVEDIALEVRRTRSNTKGILLRQAVNRVRPEIFVSIALMIQDDCCAF